MKTISEQGGDKAVDLAYYKKYEPFFGSWHIEKLIGEGSFGKVFAVRREDFGETYNAAIKIISVPQNESEIKSVMANGMDNASVTEYFEGMVKELVSEFALMSKLKGNSQIVSYEDHQIIPHEGKIGWDIIIRMELLTPLMDYAKNAALKHNDIIKLGIDMCRALELCQKRNIIHRDIKPENIFISDDGDYKLGDFGIARTIEKTSSGLSKKGTYTYMAPEVYKGEAYGSGVDIYSLGIVMYKLLNENRTPFLPPYPDKIKHSDIDSALIQRVSGEKIPMPSGADGRLAEIVLKACAYSPSVRYSSPMQMRAELEAIMYGKDEAKDIYPKGDKVDVNPNEYEATPVDLDEDSDFDTDGETVGIFPQARPVIPHNTPHNSPQNSPQDAKPRFCANCGELLSAVARFCEGCGAKVEGAKVEEAKVEEEEHAASANNVLEPNENVLLFFNGADYATGEKGILFITSLRLFHSKGDYFELSNNINNSQDINVVNDFFNGLPIDYEVPLSDIIELEEDELAYIFNIGSKGKFKCVPSADAEEHETARGLLALFAVGHPHRGWLSEGENIIMGDTCSGSVRSGALILTNKRFAFIKIGFFKSVSVYSGTTDILSIIAEKGRADFEISISDVVRIESSSVLENAVIHINSGEWFSPESVKYEDLVESIAAQKAMNLIPNNLNWI